MEYDLQTNDAVDAREAERAATQLVRWLMDERLYRNQSSSERRLFDKPLGKWTEQEMIDANWRVESVGVLVWGLSMLDPLPPYDEQLTPDDAFAALPLVAPVGLFLDEAALRPDAEIDEARDVAELWHWRSRTRHLQNDPEFKPPEDVDLSAIVEAAATLAHESGDIPEPVGRDFPAFGKAYADLDDEEYSIATSIAMERHLALTWLCGYRRDWDETPTDT